MKEYTSARGHLIKAWHGKKGAMIYNTITGEITVLLDGSEESFAVTSVEEGEKIIGFKNK